MGYTKVLFIILLSSFMHLHGYQSEDKLKAVIIGKVAKFISWQESQRDTFIITVLDSPLQDLLKKMHSKKSIKSKKVKIVHINNIDELEFTHILYIPSSKASSLKKILKKIKNKNILTISDIRGFAEKKGIVQIYFVSQKVKLKINLDVAREENLKIKSTLLAIATVIK